MTSISQSKTNSPLRQRMIEEMTLRKLAPKTQPGYIRVIKNLARFLGHSPSPPPVSAMTIHIQKLYLERLNTVLNGQQKCNGQVLLEVF